MSSSIFMLDQFSQELQLSSMKWISKTQETEMKLTVPGHRKAPQPVLTCKLVNRLNLEHVSLCRHPRGLETRGGLAGGLMSPWLASGSEAATTVTGLSALSWRKAGAPQLHGTSGWLWENKSLELWTVWSNPGLKSLSHSFWTWTTPS